MMMLLQVDGILLCELATATAACMCGNVVHGDVYVFHTSFQHIAYTRSNHIISRYHM